MNANLWRWFVGTLLVVVLTSCVVAQPGSAPNTPAGETGEGETPPAMPIAGEELTATVTLTTTPPLTGTATVTPTAPLTTPVPITGTATVTATVPITEEQPITGTATITATSTATATITPTGTVPVTGTATPTATVPITGTATPTGTIPVTGTATPTATVPVTGTITPTPIPTGPTPETPAPPGTTTPSPTAPATPTPMPSPTPTEGVPPTPTTLPEAVFIGPNRSFVEGSDLYVVGEVVNGAAEPVYNVTIIATFVDPGGQLVGAQQDVTFLPKTNPTQRNPFKVRLPNAPATVNDYQLTLTWDEISVAEYDRLTVISENVQTEGNVVISGELRNDQRSELRNIVVAATFYDASGSIVNVFRGQANTDTLAPGATTTYTVQTIGPLGDYDHFLIQTQGLLVH